MPCKTYLRNKSVLQYVSHCQREAHEGRIREGLHTRDQTLKNQISSLAETGCELFFEEKTSDAVKRRPHLEKLFGQLRKDDVVVITKLARLARSTAELLRIAEVLNEKIKVYNHLMSVGRAQRHPPEK